MLSKTYSETLLSVRSKSGNISYCKDDRLWMFLPIKEKIPWFLSNSNKRIEWEIKEEDVWILIHAGDDAPILGALLVESSLEMVYPTTSLYSH